MCTCKGGENKVENSEAQVDTREHADESNGMIKDNPNANEGREEQEQEKDLNQEPSATESKATDDVSIKNI